MESMDDFRAMARDPKHRRNFEKLLYLAAQRGDADLVAERLSWGIDPNCTFARGRTPLIGNVRGSCPSAATVRALLASHADPEIADETGLTALDYARRKLIPLQARPARHRRKSPSLDENDQLRLSPDEQAEMDEMRKQLGDDADAAEFLRIWWKERSGGATGVQRPRRAGEDRGPAGSRPGMTLSFRYRHVGLSLLANSRNLAPQNQTLALHGGLRNSFPPSFQVFREKLELVVESVRKPYSPGRGTSLLAVPFLGRFRKFII